MFGALSTRRNHQIRYEKLGEEPLMTGLLDQVRLQRSTTSLTQVPLPPSPKKFLPGTVITPSPQRKPSASKKASGKSHPLFSLFDLHRKSKKPTTARPEFARYLDYVREGGSWDANSSMPVIYHR